ncbi:hypothetical protein, partial [Phormidesmis sp. 146-12]
MGVFRFGLQRFCSPTLQSGGLLDTIFRLKSLTRGGCGGLPGFVTAAKDFIEFTLREREFDRVFSLRYLTLLPP